MIRLRALALALAATSTGCVLLVSPDQKCTPDSCPSGQSCDVGLGVCVAGLGTSATSGSGATSGSSGSSGTSGSSSSGTSGTSGTGGSSGGGTLGTPTIVPTAAVAPMRYAAVSTVVGDAIYLIGGSSDGINPAADVQVLDTASAAPTWGVYQTSTLRLARMHAMLVRTPSAVYVLSGDPGSAAGGGGAPAEVAQISGGTLGNFTTLGRLLNQSRAGAGVVQVGDCVVVTGGFDPNGGQLLDSAEWAKILPDGGLGQFTLVSSALPSGRALHAMAAVGSQVYVIGGEVEGTAGPQPAPELSHATLGADCSVGTFSKEADLLSAHVEGAALYLPASHTLYLVGGSDRSGPAPATSAIEQLTFSSSTQGFGAASEAPTSLAQARLGFSSALTDGGYYVYGGLSDSTTPITVTSFAASTEVAPLQ